MQRLPWFCDRMLLPYRLARARATTPFVADDHRSVPVPADLFRCGFPEGEVAYNGIGMGGDRTIYFGVSTKSTTPGRLFAFDRGAAHVRTIADLETAFPSTAAPAIPQGKIHVDLSAAGDRLYGATHIGYYETSSGTERPAELEGYAPYPGGWFFAIEDGRVIPLAQAPHGEGIIAMTVDTARHRAYALTWPAGRLLGLDLASNRVRDHGPVMGAGEAGPAHAHPGSGEWQRVCRSLGVHPATGDVFWSDQSGCVWRLAAERATAVARLPVADIWRKVVWHPDRGVFYGWTWRDALLFSFDPVGGTCRALGPLPVPGARQGPGTLALALDPDGSRLHALAHGPGLMRRGRIQLASTVSHVSYDLDTGTTRVRGPIVTRDGRGVTQAQSLLIAGDRAYAVAWVEVPGADRSPYAQAIRARRRDHVEYRIRGYAEEIALIRIPIGEADAPSR